MSPETKAPSPDWDAIRLAMVAGVPPMRLAKEFGVSHWTIRKRAARGSWPTPRAVTRQAQRSLSKDVQAMLPQQKYAEQAALSIAGKSLSEIGEGNALLVAQESAKLIAQAFLSQRMLPPSSWTELATANRLVRVSAGMDKQQPTISLNLWGSPLNRQAHKSEADREVESWLDVDDQSDGHA